MGNFKQRLKSNSVLKIFVEKFRCCWKIREALVDYGSKRHIIIYPYTSSWVATIWLAAAIKANHEQLTSMEKKASMEVAGQNHSPGGILQNVILKNFAKFM